VSIDLNSGTIDMVIAFCFLLLFANVPRYERFLAPREPFVEAYNLLKIAVRQICVTQ